MRSHSRRPTIFVVIPISSWNALADPESQRRMRVAMSRGFQTHDGEMTLARMVGNLGEVDNTIVQ